MPRNEYEAHAAIVDGLQSVRLAPTSPRAKRKRLGWNGKALALVAVLWIAGTLCQSQALMGLGCMVACFGVRHYWE